jgi:3-isopropylmalate/(R)-2-methylmalate dehydratase small subunit
VNGSLTAFTSHQGTAAALLRENIDTDVIIPSREITTPGREGYGIKAFAPWRYGAGGSAAGEEVADFVLNRPPWRGASILIAGANFGCGSSREMAVWALAQFGFRVLIAPSFGAIFRVNCVRNGVLPIELPAEVVARLGAAAGDEKQPLVLRVDLQAQRIFQGDAAEIAFTLDEHDREMLLTGMDAVDRTWLRRGEIEGFEGNDKADRPWVWQ